eukprot:TRINITY_DN3697_c0_g1_i3.p1 TRINITY_DN3697_c0_g1~~TRINITY_DN3697_c0_g1_i3.p1  ORF type:complete len:467 (+),score=73.26 TRINITY_DN3697_c0_g1_i3:38-1402(+)
MQPMLGFLIRFASCASASIIASGNVYCALEHRNAWIHDASGTHAMSKKIDCPYGTHMYCGKGVKRVSALECMRLCDADNACECVTWGREEAKVYNDEGACWFRTFCNTSAIDQGNYSAHYNVYVKSDRNTTCDTPVESKRCWMEPLLIIGISIVAALLCVCFVPWGYIYRRCCRCEKPQERKRLTTLAGKIWKRWTFTDPAYAAISFYQLLEMRQQAKKEFGQQYVTATMHDVNRHIIQPACEKHGKCYAHILNGHDLKFLQVFVSHSWAENFEEFVVAVESAVTNWPVKPNLWICATALMQSSDKSKVALQVGTGTDPSKAPFTRALARAEKLLIIRNTTVDIYTRIWCCWELFIAHQQGLIQKPGAVMVCGPSCPTLSWLESDVVDVEHAQASNAEDKRCILEHIRKQGAGYEEINAVLAKIKFFKATGTVGQEPQQPIPPEDDFSILARTI